MSPKERYWHLFDSDLKMKSLPKGFTDQAGLFDQEAYNVRQELASFHEIPADFPDGIQLSKQDTARIDKEAQDIHWALNYPSFSQVESCCRLINRNGDACLVYNRLPRIDQERLQLQVVGNLIGKPTYTLERKDIFPGRYTMDIPFRPSNPTI
ncbi:MAG: hypothetical protein K2Y22_08205 [Candidatus Obscuribacterales bacterium]|nr:hypothetical protein [Candidatus Obscuribacterales bacterium]